MSMTNDPRIAPITDPRIVPTLTPTTGVTPATDRWMHDVRSLAKHIRDYGFEHSISTPLELSRELADGALCALDAIDRERARLALAESRNAELERENEWRGLLVELLNKDEWYLERVDGGHQQGWYLYHYYRDNNGDKIEDRAIPWPLNYDRGSVPSRPDDATVAKIKEAIGG